jgi:putative transposase
MKSKARPFNAMLRERIKDIASARVRYGYRRIGVLLRRKGLKVNDKRVFRLYRLEGLSLRAKRPHRRRAAVARSACMVAEKRNQIWSMDFMHDRLADGRACRLLTIVDIFTRECVALDVAPRFCSDDVVRVLERVCSERDLPETLRCDNGTEFAAKPVDQWAFWNKIAEQRR